MTSTNNTTTRQARGGRRRAARRRTRRTDPLRDPAQRRAAWAVALWIAATHAITAWAHAARLVIRAPEKRCGKSRLLDMVEAHVPQPADHGQRHPGRGVPAIGTDEPPTLLVDEADTIFGGKSRRSQRRPTRALNAGHQRNRPAIR